MLARLVVAVLALLLVLNLVQSARLDRTGMLKKASDNPQWEDLGWAWGKRSVDDLEDADTMMQRYVRSFKAVKKNPDWHDLGWAWGRRR